MTKPIYIYALRDPRDGSVRYVGLSVDPRARLNGHWWDHTPRQHWHNSRKVDWVRELKIAKVKPQLEVLEVCDNETCSEREKFWILYFRKQGAPLLNVDSGGRGGRSTGRKQPEDVVKRKSDACRGKHYGFGPKSAEHRKNISEAKKLWWADKTTEQRMELMRNRGLFGSDRWEKMSPEVREKRKAQSRMTIQKVNASRWGGDHAH